MKEKKSLKLKRNGTFSIREGWLEKGLHYVSENEDCFNRTLGTQVFGLGFNMVQSLRYWLLASNIMYYNKTKAKLTEFGELLLKYDPFLDNIFSRWFIHLKLAYNDLDNPVLNEIFNINVNSFDKEYLFDYLVDRFDAEGYEKISSASSLMSDISVVLKSYYTNDTSNPEDNLSCPLRKLNLLTLSDKKIYTKKHPSYESLNCLVVLYSILQWCEKNHNKRKNISFNIEDMIWEKDNPLKILNLKLSTFYKYLDILKTKGLIEFSKTAGLNIVYINKPLSISQIFKNYFEGE